MAAQSPEKVLRCSRLDVVELDSELMNILQNKFMEIFKYLPRAGLVEKLKPELKAFVRFLLWKWSIGSDTGCTFGQSILSLKYVTRKGTELTRKHKWSLLMFYVFIGWFRERFEDVLTRLIPNSKVEKLFSYFKTTIQLANLTNFCAFLLFGEYPSLKERLLQLNMIPTIPQTLRQLTYDNMNREIIWYGFSEFIFFVLPLVNFPLLRNWLKKNLQNWKLLNQHSSTYSANRCSYCEELPVQPHVASCGHVYCYYCIAANVEADTQFPCSICNKSVVPYIQWNGL